MATLLNEYVGGCHLFIQITTGSPFRFDFLLHMKSIILLSIPFQNNLGYIVIRYNFWN